MELDRRGAELLFQALTEGEERSAIAIASNEPFSDWTKPSPTPAPSLASHPDWPGGHRKNREEPRQ